jgi:hypothetical protein
MSNITRTGGGGGEDFTMALEPQNQEGAWKVAQVVAKLGICRIKTPEDAFVRILTGRQLGLSAMQSIRQVYNINGTPALDASLMLALCYRSPHLGRFDCLESTPERAVFVAARKGGVETTLTWTLEQARKAGLSSKDTWKNYPEAMLRARCISALARMVFPDAIMGLYTAEELGEDSPPRPDESSPHLLEERVPVVEVVTPAPPSVALVPESEYAARVSATMSVEALRALLNEAKRKLPADAFQRIRSACSDKRRVIEAAIDEVHDDSHDAREAEADVIHSAND